ncbi:MAG: glycosyltransferase family 39 protein [Ignavibacteria bacterium]|nr:glycosyltransferase family 39 protein [Ignavibacteria bacterium]
MKEYVLAALASLIIFTPFLGSVRLFDWDEINFAECAREMIATGDYLHVKIDYQSFYEKPPFFIWVQAASMKMFGVNEFAARLPNALVGVVTMLVIIAVGKRFYDVKFGLIWALTYAGSLLPHFYFRSGIIDPLFNLFIFLSVYFLFKASATRLIVNSTIAAVFAACAVMTKGPVGLGLAGLTALIAWNLPISGSWTVVARRLVRSVPALAYFVVITTALSSVWFLIDYIQNGPSFVLENINYQIRLLTTGEAGHAQPFWYHPVVVLLGCFPASFLIFGGLRSLPSDESAQKVYRVWMIVLLLVVLIVFSIVKTKIIHYSSMTYLPLTFLAALSARRWINGERTMRWFQSWAVVIYGILLSAVLSFGLYALSHKDWLLSLPSVRDKFLRASLMQDIKWFGFEPFIPLILFVGVLFFIVMKRRGSHLYAILSLYISVILFISTFLPTVAPRIEQYTQGASIDFYESLVGRNVYVKPLTMKSYAHLFYTRKPYTLSAASLGLEQDQWEPFLLNGPVTKPAYFVCKVNDAQRWREHPNLEVYSEQGGFVFFSRKSK